MAHATASDLIWPRGCRGAESRFAVSRVDVAGAAAYVLAGSDVPEEWRPPQSTVVFAVTPGRRHARPACLTSGPGTGLDRSVAPVVATVSVDGSGDRGDRRARG
ncbi:MAG: hypothetical protein IPL75_12890 [Acidobacteria bacterium]|nr:hypothetical protein [Acidobacteriota bacterium]